MSLTPGSKLGIYEVVAPLGAGGMGEVYRARDTKLGRDVAIKALPPQFAQDPERLARFEREAKLLASLSHPHIAGIFGLEDIDNHRYLVLEFVEGETLAQRLDHGTLSIEEALQFARQIASALESAHEQGIAHRDLKPGNVMITLAGDVKVLDFGLAKGGMGSNSSSDVNLTHSPTLTHQHTGAGVILGTAAYMSPEQARGRTLDKRTDIWSFGCVLYECLTGRQAFAGETVSDLIARILEREPDWEALPSRTPQRILDLLRRCLEKDSKRRLRDIGDARIEIEDVMATKTSSPEAVAAAAAHRSRVKLRTILGAVALVVITAAATYFVVPRGSNESAMRPTRFEIAEMPGFLMNIDGAHSAISPDGRMLAYTARDSTGTERLWLRPLESLVAREIPGTDGAAMPFWSPDGRFIGYFNGGQKMSKVAVAGGAPEAIADVKGPRGGTWNRDGVILYAPLSEGPISRISANGGEGTPITTLDSTGTGHRYPVFLPDGEHFLCTAIPPRDGKYTILFGSMGGKGLTTVIDNAGSGALYADPGYLIYQRDGVVVAHPFDAKKGRVIGEPVSLGDRPLGTGYSGAAGLSVALDGTLAFTTNTPFATHLVWADMNGKQTADVPMAPGKYVGVEVSPDGRQAVLESSPRIGISELWMADLERGVVTRLSYEPGENTGARWSPDGTRVAYAATTMGGFPKIVVVDVAGGVTESYLTNDPVFKNVYSWTPDGRALIYGRQVPETRWDIWILPLDGDHTPRPYLVTPYFENNARVSPDGRWMQYASDESGRFEVYVQAFPNGGGKYQVTTRGGFSGGWSADARQLRFAYAGDNKTAYAADVLPGPQFRLGPARVRARFPDNFFDAGFPRAGDRMMLLVPARPLPPQSITIVQNWPALLVHK